MATSKRGDVTEPLGSRGAGGGAGARAASGEALRDAVGDARARDQQALAAALGAGWTELDLQVRRRVVHAVAGLVRRGAIRVGTPMPYPLRDDHVPDFVTRLCAARELLRSGEQLFEVALPALLGPVPHALPGQPLQASQAELSCAAALVVLADRARAAEAAVAALGAPGRREVAALEELGWRARATLREPRFAAALQQARGHLASGNLEALAPPRGVGNAGARALVGGFIGERPPADAPLAPALARLDATRLYALLVGLELALAIADEVNTPVRQTYDAATGTWLSALEVALGAEVGAARLRVLFGPLPSAEPAAFDDGMEPPELVLEVLAEDGEVLRQVPVVCEYGVLGDPAGARRRLAACFYAMDPERVRGGLVVYPQKLRGTKGGSKAAPFVELSVDARGKRVQGLLLRAEEPLASETAGLVAAWLAGG